MFGKILGALVGLSVGLLLGSGQVAVLLALAGVAVGHRFDAQPAPVPEIDLPAPRRREQIDAEARVHFARHLCGLMVAVARSEGEVLQPQVREMRRFFEEGLRFSPVELDEVRGLLKRAVAAPTDPHRAAQACAETLAAPERELLLEALYRLALSTGALGARMRALLREVGETLVREETKRRALEARLLATAGPYEVLGLSPTASDDEVRRAFRRLAAEEHPDRVAHLGPGAVALAEERFRTLKDAYDAVRRERGG